MFLPVAVGGTVYFAQPDVFKKVNTIIVCVTIALSFMAWLFYENIMSY